MTLRKAFKNRTFRFFFIFYSALTIYLPASANASTSDKFIGAEQCLSCHSEQHSDWKKSDHYKSMTAATEEFVLGNFNNASVEFHGVKSRFFRRNGEYFINTAGPDGKLQDYKISYTFGFEPLQQYLVELDNGHIQALNIAWDSRPKTQGGQRWYHLRKDEEITPEHPFYWTRHFQNWNSRCADCHSTNLDKNYDPVKASYSSTWDEINVSCESCHGPGNKHASLAGSNKLTEKNSGFDVKLPKPAAWAFNDSSDIASPVNADIEAIKHNTINTCGACHSRRAALGKTEHGKDFHQQFMLTTMNQGLYHADGQIQDEVFVLGSFVKSKMFEAGVTCGNCHQPHTGKLKVEGNGLCLQCHKSQKFEQKTHHGHPLQSSGAKCTACHMPQTTYMGVDDRADHSFSIPRPDLSQQFETPNACEGCHQDKGNDWAQTAIESWADYKAGDADTQRMASRVFEASWTQSNYRSRKLDPLIVRKIQGVIASPGLTKMQHATLLNQLASIPSRVAVEVAQPALTDSDPLVRRAAVASLQSSPPQTRINLLLPLLADPSLAVRSQVAMALVDIRNQVPAPSIDALNKVIMEYHDTLLYNQDSPAGLSSLAGFNISMQDYTAVEQLYLKAIAIEPSYVPALVNLADWYRASGNEQKAGEYLQKAVTVGPDSAMAHHSLGLHQIRVKQYEKAMLNLKKSTELEDTQPRYIMVYAIALDNFGRTVEAESLLVKGVNDWPNQFELLLNLVSVMERSGRLAEAGVYISNLTKIAPSAPQVQALAQKYRRAIEQ